MSYEDSHTIIESLFTNSTKMAFSTDREHSVLQDVFSKLEGAKEVDENTYVRESIKPQIILFERPDLVIELDEYIIIIEHFQVDSSKRTTKGSKYKHKYNGRYYEEKIKNLVEEISKGFEVSKYSEQITTSFKYEQLYANTLNIIREHHAKVELYKDNIAKKIKSKNKKNIYSFFC